MLEYEPPERNTPAAIERRKEFCLEAAGWNTRDIIFIDEMGFDMHRNRRRGRAPRGQRALSIRACSSGPHVTVIAAINPVHGVMHWEMLYGGVTGERYANFLENLLRHTACHTRSMRLIIDNTRIHQVQRVEEVVQAYPTRQTISYLPPYSPHLNAVEYCFAPWAKYVNKHEKRNHEALLELIRQAVATTTIEDCDGYAREVTRYHILCGQGHPLRYRPPRQIE